MATTKGPLMSLDASGTVGSAIVFSHWKGRNVVRRHAVPANPQSAGQVAVRALLKFLSQQWSGLTAGNQATWDDPASGPNISPFNAYVGYSGNRWTHYGGPTKEYPAAESNAGGDAPTTTPTAAVKEISLSIADGVTPPDWGWAIHRSTSTGFTPSKSTLVAMVERTGTPTVYLDTPLLTGTAYYYRIQGFSDDGVMGTLEAERTATPT
jgi:hypothetical protein